MGLNAEIWVLGEHPAEQVEKAEALLANRLPGFLVPSDGPYGPPGLGDKKRGERVFL